MKHLVLHEFLTQCHDQCCDQTHRHSHRKQYDPFIRSNFLTEEVGEVCRAIRTIEIGRDRPDETVLADEENLENLTEELGDVLDNLFILADKYDISLEMIMQKHRTKLMERYPEE